MKKKPTVQYDFMKKRQLATRASLRGLVSLYLCFLAWDLVKLGPDVEGMPYWGRLLAAVIFVAVAIGFGLYTWRNYQASLQDAVLSEEEVAALEPSEESESLLIGDEAPEDEE